MLRHDLNVEELELAPTQAHRELGESDFRCIRSPVEHRLATERRPHGDAENAPYERPLGLETPNLEASGETQTVQLSVEPGHLGNDPCSVGTFLPTGADYVVKSLVERDLVGVTTQNAP